MNETITDERRPVPQYHSVSVQACTILVWLELGRPGRAARTWQTVWRWVS
jgi:hypothetical protein